MKRNNEKTSVQRRTRSLVTVSALLASAALVLSGCAGTSDDSGAAKSIKILVAAPLTGASAESGQDMVHGAELAAQYLNELGGVTSGELQGAQFEIEGVDDEGSTEAATTIAARVADDPDIYALTGFITSGQAQAAGVVLDRAGLGMVVSFAGADFLTTEADNLGIVLASLSDTGRVAGNFASVELGLTSAGSIAGDYSFLDSYYKGLDLGLADGGGQNVSKQTYTEGTADFSTLLTNIESAGADVVMSGAFQTDAGLIINQMRKAGMTQPVVDFLGEGWGESFGEAAGSALDQGDVYQIDALDAFPAEGTLASDVSKRFAEEYGKAMPAAAVHTFDSVLTIAAAIEAGATQREDLIATLPNLSGEGLLGPIGFTEELRPIERIITVSKVTGPKPSDREFVAYYTANRDGTVTKK